jgi:hypothetical protein
MTADKGQAILQGKVTDTSGGAIADAEILVHIDKSRTHA